MTTILKSKKNIYLFRILIVTIILFIVVYFTFFNSTATINYSNPFADSNELWADSVLTTLNIDEKIGQIIMYSPQDSSFSEEELMKFVEKYSIGSCKIIADSLLHHFELINKLQNETKIPLLIVNNSENIYHGWIKDISTLPSQDILNNVSNDSILNFYFEKLSKNIKALDYSSNIYNEHFISEDENAYDTVFINMYLKRFLLFANNSYKNHIINIIPFQMFMQKDTSRVSYVERFYKKLIFNGICGFYINSNNFDDFEKFSENNDFSGLDFYNYENEESLDDFFSSDIEILIINSNFEENIKKISELIKTEKSFQVKIDKKVKQILLAKSWITKNTTENNNPDSLKTSLKSSDILLANRYICENSIILQKNDDTIIPFTNLEKKSFYIITIGEEKTEEFETYFEFYYPTESKFIDGNDENILDKITVYPTYNNVIIAFNNYQPDSILIEKILCLKNENKIIVNFGNIENLEKLEKFDTFSTVIQTFSNNIVEQQYAAQLLFGGISANGQIPYNIGQEIKFGEGLKTEQTRLKYTIAEEVGISTEKIEKIDSIVMNAIYSGAMPGCQVFVAKNGKVIYNKAFGTHTYVGSPVKTDDLYDIASITKVAATTLATMKMYEKGKLGLDTKIGTYFKNTKIEYTRIKPDTILNIDTLELKDIKDMKKLLKYQDTIHLTDSLIVAYDTLIVMSTPSNNIFTVTPRELLVHASGIQPAMPILRFLFYKQNFIEEYKINIAKNDTSNIDTSIIEIDYAKAYKEAFKKYFSTQKIKDSAEVQIAQNMYLNKRYEDTLWIDTKQLRNYSRKIFVYSDVNMILLQQTIDTINDYDIETFLKAYFYNPLGLKSTCYLPREKVGLGKIIPTEYDKAFRNQLLVGYVHDPSAAMLGGISGNAGLFSSAQDLGVIFQMLLNGGTYGGERYLQQSTVDLFTKTQEDSHRGLGFDKPFKNTIIAEDASPNSWGHTGFTGCCVWVDPDEELVYVFLSNRVNPSANNWRLNSLKVREKVHQAIYDAILNNI